MAEKEKKPRAPRKPRQPKEITPLEEITKEEVAPKEEITEEVASPEITPEEITPLEEIASFEERSLEVAKPEEIITSEKLPERYAVTLRKLNPHLEDGKSKWAFELVKDQKHHTIFKGSYVRAYKWAENYCKVHGIASSKIQKIHK